MDKRKTNKRLPRTLVPDDFPLTVRRMMTQEPTAMHSHEFSELVVVTAGEGMHQTGTEEYPVGEGDVFLLHGSREHGYADTHGLCLVNILFRFEELRLPVEDVRALSGYHALFRLEPRYRRQHRFQSRLHLSPERLAVLEGLIGALEGELAARREGFAFLAKALFMEMVGRLCRWYTSTAEGSSLALLRLGSVLSRLEQRSEAAVSLRELAEMAHMSTSSFLRAFREATGTSPLQYAIRLRVQRSCRLFREGGATVTEAAHRTGFSDSNYFARQFRQVMGMTPSQYRKRWGPDGGVQAAG